LSRYVVTGCAGFIGSHLTEALLSAGHDVLGIDAFSDYYEPKLKRTNLAKALENDTFTLVEGDVLELPIERLFAGSDGIFHLAAQPGVRGSWGAAFATYVRDNILASQRVFEATAKVGARCVWASSSSIYGNAEGYPTREDARPEPISPYGVTKLACEHLGQSHRIAFGLDHVALRYFTVYGPRQRPDMAFTRLLNALVAGTPFHVYGTGEQSRDVTYVADAVSATIAAMDAAPQEAVYNVGGGTETTLNDVIALAEELTGRRLDTSYERAMEGDVRRTSADTTLIREQLGWQPRVDLRSGLEAQIGWLSAYRAPG
jgi:UDP-glucuronate 4-epimerase